MQRLAMMATGALLAASLCCEAAGPQQYTIQDLGTSSTGDWIEGFALNSTDQVVGLVTSFPTGPTHAMLWSAGSMIDLGTLGGQSSQASGINDAGQIVGNAQTSAGSAHAFLYQNGAMLDLGTLGGTSSAVLGGAGSAAYGISSCGLIVGDAATASGDTHAFLYANASMTDLGTLGGPNSDAVAVNSAGQIVGFSDTSTLTQTLGSFPINVSHAFLYSAGSMQDLGALPGLPFSKAYAINSAGDVVGIADDASGLGSNAQHAFLYSHGVMQDLGVPAGMTGVNVAGVDSADDVVGSAGSFSFPLPTNSSFTTSHGFIYSSGDGWTDLNTLLDPNDPLAPYVVITSAGDINEAGVILAGGLDSRSPGWEPHSYLLTPAVPPEPSSAPSPCVASSSSSSSSTSASSSSSASTGPDAFSDAAIASGPSGATGGGGDFDALTLVLLAGAVLRAVASRRARV